MKAKYGIMALGKKTGKDGRNAILHVCCYKKKPTKRDFRSLQDELSTCKKFGLVGKEDKYILVNAPKEVIDVFSKVVEHGGRK